MSFPKKFTLTGTTASGALVCYSTSSNGPPYAFGRVVMVKYTKDATNGFADGSTMTLTTEDTGQTIWAQTGVNASTIVYPTTQVQGSTGTGLTYDGTRTVCEPIMVCHERLVMTVSSAGNGKVGTWDVYVE